MDNRHFLIIVPVDFRVLPDLIRCRLMFEIEPIIIILSCSSNMVAEGIGGQASGTVARRRRATLLVLYIKLIVSVCVFAICACVSCSVALKLTVVAEGTRGRVIAG